VEKRATRGQEGSLLVKMFQDLDEATTGSVFINRMKLPERS